MALPIPGRRYAVGTVAPVVQGSIKGSDIGASNREGSNVRESVYGWKDKPKSKYCAMMPVIAALAKKKTSGSRSREEGVYKSA